MQNVINNCSEKMKKSVASLQADYAQLRTGRASAALFDKLKVDYYGAETPLSQVASISVPEARMVVIQPWDKTVLPAIEKAIQKAQKLREQGSIVTMIPADTDHKKDDYINYAMKNHIAKVDFMDDET